jgi:AcrR family transcriptional regulator
LGHHGWHMPLEKLTPERRRELTRNALVDAAAEVFARRGFQAASLDEIAEAAGFTRGAIYSNFGGKDDLMLAVVEQHSQSLIGAFSSAMDTEAAPDQRAAVAAALWKDIVRRDRNLVALWLEFRLYALRNPQFRRRLAEVERQQVAEIVRMIEREVEDLGITMKMPAEDMAEIMNAWSIGLSELAAVDLENASRYDELTQRFFRFVAESVMGSAQEIQTPAKKGKASSSAG